MLLLRCASSARGGLSYRIESEDSHGRRVVRNQTTGPVRSVDGDLKLNRALWALAAKMAELKGQA